MKQLLLLFPAAFLISGTINKIEIFYLINT